MYNHYAFATKNHLLRYLVTTSDFTKPTRDLYDSAWGLELMVQMANENPSWGYNKIQGALANLGYEISDTAIGNILKEHGIEPAPERKRQTTWKAFLQAHWDVLAAIDYRSRLGGVLRYYHRKAASLI
jgi:hypothetical protein